MKTTLLISYFFLFSIVVFAQGPPQNEPSPKQDQPRPVKERVEALKVGFLTERLNLSPEEAKTFWPVYNQYQDELENLRKSRRDNLVNAKMNFDEMGDKDLEKAVDAELAFRQNELDLQKKYHVRFKQVLPMKKVAKLYKAEEDFKRQLLEKIKENRMDRQERRPLKNR
jgi:hypothetical protein